MTIVTTFRGRPLATWMALLACVLVTCLPGSLVRLNACECGSVVVEVRSDDAGCCCVEDEPEASSDDRPPLPDPSGLCCTDLPLPDLLGDGSRSTDDAASDETPPPCFAAPAPPPCTATARAPRVSATGPPGAHRVLRALELHRSIVLLI